MVDLACRVIETGVMKTIFIFLALPYLLLFQGKSLQQDYKIANDPSVRKITIQYNATQEEKGLISVFFSDGKLLGRKQVNINKGVNVWEYYFPSTATGIFLIKLTSKTTTRTAKIQKKIRQG